MTALHTEAPRPSAGPGGEVGGGYLRAGTYWPAEPAVGPLTPECFAGTQTTIEGRPLPRMPSQQW